MKPCEVRVAITGFQGLDDRDCGAAVARALRAGWNGPISIDALGCDPMMTGAWMPGIADRLHLIPESTAGDHAMLTRLLELHAQWPFEVLIPCTSEDVSMISRISGALTDAGIRVLLPKPEYLVNVAPPRLPDFCFEHATAAPGSIFLTDFEDLPDQADRLGYPLLVKDPVSGEKTVYSQQEALSEAQRLQRLRGEGVVLQQKVAGDEYAVALVMDAGGTCVGMSAMRKLAMNEAGKEECGSAVDDPVINQLALDIAAEMKWRGPLVLDFVRPPGVRKPWLKGLHCHFPAWVMLSHWAGNNLPVKLLEILLEQSNAQSEFDHAGSMLIHGVTEAAVPAASIAELQRKGSIQHPGHAAKLKAVEDEPVDEVTVAVTGISTFDLINPGLGAARALKGARGIRKVIGLNYGNFDSGSFQAEICDMAYRLPITQDDSVFMQRLQEIHQAAPFDVLLPCLDGELPRFIALRKEIEALGVSLLLPEQEAFDRRAKLSLFNPETAPQCEGIEIPESVIAWSLEDLQYAWQRFGAPLAVKGPLYGCVRINSEQDIASAWKKFQGWGVYSVIAQPWIDGDVFAVAAVCDENHQTIASLTVEKLASCHRGSTWSAQFVEHPELESSFADLLEMMDWVGPAEGEFIYNAKADKYYLFEINPRFTGWISYSDALGSNHPLLAVQAAMGKKTKPASNTTHLIFMRSSSSIELKPTALASLTLKGTIQNG